MLRGVARVIVLLAAPSGLLARFSGAGHAVVGFNPGEPLPRA
jgi:hypothetical protein